MMPQDYMPAHPVYLDWIVVIVVAIAFGVISFTLGRKRPGYLPFILCLLVIPPSFVSWSNIFMNAATGTDLNTLGQMFMLAPLFGHALMIIAAWKLNLSFNKEQTGER